MDAALKSHLDRRQSLIDQVRALIVKQTGRRLDPGDIDPDAPLFVSGLGLDSVDTVELIIALESELGLALPSDTKAIPALRTVNTIVDAVLALPGGTNRAA
ncbi:MAG TPA: phosphopantetheine-binding protein [Myxococcaceae bacterium]|nr:phosphopantetheine-binding protein [Myxococcaceae bacterium]